MPGKLVVTQDGSHSVSVDGSLLTYHSTFGAITESRHVFIHAGLDEVLKNKKQISIFEMGFGTGLSALLTLITAGETGAGISYETTETDPLDDDILQRLNYSSVLNKTEYQPILIAMHHCAWDTEVYITPEFRLYKRKTDIREIEFSRKYNLVYYDAFDPVSQPELWTTDIFKKIYHVMYPYGILVTYSSKGAVRRAMQEAGFRIEKLPGPKGKREFTRATAIKEIDS